MWWINVQGVHPQTGETVNAWDCSINWIPVLTVDVARQARSGAAATESFRNEMVKLNGARHAMLRNSSIVEPCQHGQHVWETYQPIGQGNYSTRCSKCGVISGSPERLS